MIIEGNWTAYRNKVLSYLRQLAIVTPYAQFHFKYVSAGGDARETWTPCSVVARR